ncbi:3-hydroxyisobutyryl-CoA hydrolase [Chitinasiproducens palmae]|uniref:3-hydroxyisobutyryl-CoA hydrolase n=1 Tax=Chitinasiproducens palmae TaxID=1770053 RepID=A0A1H2PS40_9BURK|nr:3-hydroxyisobutyryl-CoA hydrolase [Chitinasiproducens palmae]SDV49764.1 Enoyl-CoA hydratase/carnithine racemase [Chitinasiproducens palmae]
MLEKEEIAAPILFDAPGNGLGFVTLNRARALNALSREMLVSLHAQLQQWESDSSIKAVFVHSSSPRSFCAGGDIKSLYYSGIKGNTAEILDFFTDEYRCNYAISAFSKPYISLAQGIVMGGGMGISQPGVFTGGLRLVTPSTRMAMPETRIGLIPDVGVSYMLARAPGRLGDYMAVTGESITWQQALSAGLADKAIADAAAETLPARLRGAQFDSAADVIAFIGEVALDAPSSDAAAQEAGEASVQHATPLIEQHFAGATVADIVASLAADPSDWAQLTLTTLRSRSPLSMALSLAHVRRAARQTFAACLQDDLTLVARILERGDLIEGIRALLIDKDGRPQWRPADVDGLAQVNIDRYFESPWDAHPLHDLA